MDCGIASRRRRGALACSSATKGRSSGALHEHLLEVASLVADATDGRDPELVIAALLHDAIEDQEVPSELITSEFGTRVAAIVAEVTDDKSLDKAEHKRLQIEHAPKKTDAAKFIKLADKTSNVRAIAFAPSADWSVKRRLEYIDWAKKVVHGLRGASPWLEEQFDRAVEDAERSLAIPKPRT
jgi:(p)ppGpp synthase/HD superfamily hydrolase